MVFIFSDTTGTEQSDVYLHSEAGLMTEEDIVVYANLLGGDDFFTRVQLLPSPTTYRLYVDGGEGDDFIAGGDRADVLVGGDGDDQLYGLSGNDELHPGPSSVDMNYVIPGAGMDLVYLDPESTNRITLSGVGGYDIITGAGSDEQFLYAAGDLTLEYSEGDTFLNSDNQRIAHVVGYAVTPDQLL